MAHAHPPSGAGAYAGYMRSLVGISHGTASAAGQLAIAHLMAAVTTANPDVQVSSGCVDVQRPNVAEALAALPNGQTSVIVPLLLSGGYHVHVDLERAVQANRSMCVLARTLGPDHRIATVQRTRLIESGWVPGSPPDDAVVIMVAAGSSDSRAADDCLEAGALLAHAIGQTVTVAYLAAQDPTPAEAIDAARQQHPHRPIFVSSYLLAPGYFQSLLESTFGRNRNADADADVSGQSHAGVTVTAPILNAAGQPDAALVNLISDRYHTAATECSDGPILLPTLPTLPRSEI